MTNKMNIMIDSEKNPMEADDPTLWCTFSWFEGLNIAHL